MTDHSPLEATGVVSEKHTELIYFLEGDDELKRLQKQHPVIKAAMGGQLILAPIDFTKQDMRILDSGTSDGTWLLDFRKDIAHTHRNNAFVGVDINEKSFISPLPEDVQLVEQNVLDPWPPSWRESFDLVHQRLVLVTGGKDMRNLLQRELELVKPGGWIQLIEAENTCADDDGPVMRQFQDLTMELFDKLGCEERFPRKLRGWLEEEGMVNTGENLIPYLLGAKCKTPEFYEQSVVSACIGVSGLAEYGKSFGDDLKSLNREDLDTLVSRFRAEMLKQGGYYPLRVVWGQKPHSP